MSTESSAPRTASKRRGTLALLTIVCAALMLIASGCSGQSGYMGEITVSVKPNGGATLRVAAPGAPSEEAEAGLSRGGWNVESSGDEWTAECDVKPKDLNEQAETMLLSLSSAFAEAESFAPEIQETPRVEIDTDDYFVVSRVSASLTFPEGTVEPDDCPSCAGSGEEECPNCDATGTEECAECSGDGYETCDECGGSGGEECSNCDGTGTYEDYWGYTEECYWCDGTGTEECYWCDGYGEVECYECYGYGEVDCSWCDGYAWTNCADCGGSGEPSQAVLETYADAVDTSNLSATLAMPGMFVKAADGSSSTTWKVSGEDALSGEEYSASSWVIDWVNAGIIVGAFLLVIVGISAALIVSSRKKRAAAAASAPVAPPQTADATTPVALSAPFVAPNTTASSEPSAFCTGCGNPLSPTAKFCTNCGTSR